MKQATLLLILLITAGTLMAGDVAMTLNPSADLYNQFSAGYVDPLDPMSQPILFNMTITNTSGAAIDDWDLLVTFIWNDVELMSREPAEAKNSLHVGANMFTSRDIISEDNDHFSTDINFEDIMSMSSAFEDAIKNTGRFPDGAYTFTVEFQDNGNSNNDASVTMQFNIVSPISIQLLYPGSAIGGQVQPYLETFPNFIWASNLTGYHFYLWELEPGMNVSAEDVENMHPDYTCFSPMSSLSYPADAPALQVGGVYAWQVRGGLISPADLSGSDNTIKSPVFAFRVANPEDNTVYNQILANFLNNIDGDSFSEVYDLLSQGFAPTGNIVFNGQEMSFEELNALLIQILNGEIEVKGLIIE